MSWSSVVQGILRAVVLVGFLVVAAGTSSTKGAHIGTGLGLLIGIGLLVAAGALALIAGAAAPASGPSGGTVVKLGVLLVVLGLFVLVLGGIAAYRTPEAEGVNFGSAILFNAGLLFLALGALVILIDVARRRRR
ncbi:MAG: hypothetical protein M3P96_03590 [Actinomycetota bacterium]|nr:hypothetical protein [Actinomycetota bacterium]